ncbi:unnamed protein product [Acanthoscelides obtectus]|uniref:DDB1- and CUL4-associated factor 15 WD40 repeat-containing domain-containing protein n=1 Tax=Acanthoscelides obtectus TaxID=200917 RepID=A0A9P0LVJ8_ACAOB|nr:unnamed protein product [Acanthoscelides obtectus]CAK1620533.1 DDB1- and CUL4-associated factor 15 [Acanthoscelides obtectus]
MFVNPNLKVVRQINNTFENFQLYGRFTRNPKAKTERIFNDVHPKNRFALNSLLEEHEYLTHIYMGFTLCGRYFVSYTEKLVEEGLGLIDFNASYEYYLHLWRFVPGMKLQYLSKHKIFKHINGPYSIDKVIFMQSPGDLYKLVCYGVGSTSPDLVYMSILTLPAPKNCKHCNAGFLPFDESVNQGWCIKHGFIVHYMLPTTSTSKFDPHISLAYPNHLVVNTGHHIHILNVQSTEPPQASNVSLPSLAREDDKTSQTPTHTFTDTLSEASETPSEFGLNSTVDAILEDFSEYDLESNECSKPFHELNISCEPLNVTGKSYHNTLVQNIVDPRLKRLQMTSSKDYHFSVPQCSSAQKPTEKSKIDKKLLEKTYEFIEENEKYEKISMFRKRRLAEKKYEFSEDNSENIVPFYSLRRERRYLYRSQSRCIRSPDLISLFLSPRSPGWRSPMQSPNSRNGQFSPSGGRNLYCPTSVSNSPHHSKSPISPRESARKFHVYSPSLDSDCSDFDSRLILKAPGGASISSGSGDTRTGGTGLLIVDPKVEAPPKWIKRIVRRYSNGDFENSSLVSGQSRDDYNIPIEIPLLVQNLTEQHMDVVPDFKVDQVTEMQLIVTQRSFDCEQFVEGRAQKLCSDAQLEFLHFKDYDIRIIHICPMNGHITCQAVIKIGARSRLGPRATLQNLTANFLFTWSIETDAFELCDGGGTARLRTCGEDDDAEEEVETPKVSNEMCDVLVMDYVHTASTKPALRDHQNYYEVCLGSQISTRSHQRYISEYSSDSD